MFSIPLSFKILKFGQAHFGSEKIAPSYILPTQEKKETYFFTAPLQENRMAAIYYFILFACFFKACLFTTTVTAEENPQKKTVCLNMIVKNETKVIQRGLATVKPLIDYWVIVDTGSTDGTQEMIKTFMQDIPGQLHERPWKNFEHNRNQALDLAKGKADYILFIDADEYLEFAPHFKMPPLHMDSYDSLITSTNLQYNRTLLIKDGLDWKWKGVLHEYIGSSKAKSKGVIEGINKISKREGARSSDPLKYQKDAQVLEEALKEEPENSRYVFYLAQSYRDCGDYASAVKNYEKRAKMGGWDEEVFCSLLQAAKMQQALKMDPIIFAKSYLAAFQYRQRRAEPLYYLAKYYRTQKDYEKAYSLSTQGMKIPLPKDILFVEKWIYDYGLKTECSVSSYWVGKYEESQRLCKELLADPTLPQEYRKLTEQNIIYANDKIEEKVTHQ